MILIIGFATVRPECRDSALALGVNHSRRSRREPGCLAHNCHFDAEDPNRIVFVEEWADMAAMQAHFEVPDSGEFVRAIGAMCDREPEIRIYSADRVR